MRTISYVSTDTQLYKKRCVLKFSPLESYHGPHEIDVVVVGTETEFVETRRAIEGGGLIVVVVVHVRRGGVHAKVEGRLYSCHVGKSFFVLQEFRCFWAALRKQTFLSICDAESRL